VFEVRGPKSKVGNRFLSVKSFRVCLRFDEYVFRQMPAEREVLVIATNVKRPAERRPAQHFDVIAGMDADFVEMLPAPTAVENLGDPGGDLKFKLGERFGFVVAVH
jgi:hypothetical protein